MIERNRNKYSVSAMCEVLQIARSTFYYETEIAAQKEQEKAAEEQKLKEEIQMIFNKNRQVYGTRKIKNALFKTGHMVSRRRIGRLMEELGTQSKKSIMKSKAASTTDDPRGQEILIAEKQLKDLRDPLNGMVGVLMKKPKKSAKFLSNLSQILVFT
ncbi:hypothetical protein QF028_005935 [Neobacillus sp. B4I6]|uniref:IS3 family transposase n=1 Tax=Neobacillus sp. B4I6 TaxID=3373925 RepID=UPI003D1E6EE7